NAEFNSNYRLMAPATRELVKSAEGFSVPTLRRAQGRAIPVLVGGGVAVGRRAALGRTVSILVDRSIAVGRCAALGRTVPILVNRGLCRRWQSDGREDR